MYILRGSESTASLLLLLYKRERKDMIYHENAKEHEEVH